MSTKEYRADVIIIGGGLGSIAAALSIAKMGCSCIITEETDWIGGQLTSQAVPMDEHPWMESFGCTQNYRYLRNEIRNYYKKFYPLTQKSQNDPFFSPGASLTTRLPCEPKVALSVLESMLAPFCANESITILKEYKAEVVNSDGDNISSIKCKDLVTGDYIELYGDYYLDGTETGELLNLGNIEYVTGAESKDDTGEPHALEGPPEPLNMQAFTYCYALAHHPNENHIIEKPNKYDFWQQYSAEFQSGKHLSWNPQPNRNYIFFPDKKSDLFSIWQYRRIFYKENFAEGFLKGDISLINSSHNDYWLGPIIDVAQEEKQKHLDMAKQLSMSALYWFQTEAPRSDGGYGYPGLKLRHDYMDTRNGLAKYPYIRESRRLVSEFTIKEQHVGLEALGEKQQAQSFFDSIGIGCYNIDLHPTTGGQPSLNIKTRPFQVPLGALIPIRVKNMLAASKNIGTTHITNGCYRLHSIEWNIGEAAGALVAFCKTKKVEPKQVRNDRSLLNEYQSLLQKLGVELEWPQLSVGTSYHKSVKGIEDHDWGETDDRSIWNL